jgi:uncharacterized protein (TIGR00369 family)
MVDMPFEYLEDNCFVCGAANPDGLKLDFKHETAGRSEVRCAFDERFQGYDGVVHGGILTAVLDDSMAHAVMAIGLMPITAEMKVRFRRPIRVGEEILFEGWVTKSGRRFIETAAVGKGPDGEVRVQAEGKFAISVA